MSCICKFSDCADPVSYAISEMSKGMDIELIGNDFVSFVPANEVVPLFDTPEDAYEWKKAHWKRE